jgi:hypothetical protein
MFSGKKFDSSFILSFTAVAVASALALGESSTESPAVDWPFWRVVN